MEHKTNNSPIIQSLTKQDREIATIVWAEGIPTDAVPKVIRDSAKFHELPTGFYLISTDFANVLPLVGRLPRQFENCRISMVIDVMNPSHPSPSLLVQAGAMARASGGGGVMTDHNSAMVAIILSKEVSIEEIGELKTATNVLSLWTLS